MGGRNRHSLGTSLRSMRSTTKETCFEQRRAKNKHWSLSLQGNLRLEVLIILAGAIEKAVWEAAINNTWWSKCASSSAINRLGDLGSQSMVEFQTNRPFCSLLVPSMSRRVPATVGVDWRNLGFNLHTTTYTRMTSGKLPTLFKLRMVTIS